MNKTLALQGVHGNSKIVMQLYNQVLEEIKITIRILSQTALITMKIWLKYDEITSLIHSETKPSTVINLSSYNLSLNNN